MKRVIVFIVILALALFIVQAAFAGKGAKVEEIKVGTLLSHTGPLKEFGPAIQNGVILAAKQLGEAGLTFKLVHEDSET